MAIIGPADLPVVLKVDSNPIKKYCLTKLGYPTVEVEISEDQWETLIRIGGDFISGYFPREQRLAVFWTNPLQSTYPMPEDAYWIQEVSWDPVTTRIDDVFGAESFLFNIGNISGTQGLLLDYHLLQSYRKFSQKILGTWGSWDVMGEKVGDTTKQVIRLYPTPKGVFPVVVLYMPVITIFRSPQARRLCMDMILAEAKQALGAARRKISNMPSPTGGAMATDGDKLVDEGKAEVEALKQEAILLGEPLGVFVW